MKSLVKFALAATIALVGGIAAADSRIDRVDAYRTNSHDVYLRAGVPAMILVDGDGDTDLDATLFDENGNVIDADLDGTDFCILEVTPRWSGWFRVEIDNYGDVYNEYEISVE